MIDKEEYKKELIRMFASFRHDKAKFEYCFCSCEQCDNCPLLDCCHMHGTVRPYDVFEVIEKVEKWSKDHPKPRYKISQMEYDVLESIVKTIISGLYFFECDSLLMSLLEKGYFDGATPGTNVKEYFKNCEVDCELGGNENVKRRKV